MPITIKDGKITGTIQHQAGWEAAALGGAAPIDLNGDGNSFGFDAPLETGVTSAVVFAVYNSVLTALQLEPLVKSGALSRQDQMNAMWSAAGDGIRRNWVKMLAVTVVVSLLPGLGPVLGVASIFGSVFMVNKLARSFWMSLSVEQRSDLQAAADKAGVKLPGTEGSSKGTAAGYDETDPLPQGT